MRQDACVVDSVETARLPPYFEAIQGCGSVGVVPGMFREYWTDG